MKRSIKRIVMLSLMMVAFSVCAFAQQYVVTGNGVRIRTTADRYGNNVCGSVNRGTVLQGTGYYDGDMRGVYYKGKKRYIAAEYVCEPDPGEGDGDYVIIDYGRRNVCIRTAPSTNSKVLGHANSGDQFPFLGQTSGWYKIRYRGGVGWVTKQYSH